MGIYLRIFVRDGSGLMIFLAILIFGTKSLASDSPAGFISIDCGSNKSSTDPQTNLLWVADGDYIRSGSNGLIRNQEGMSNFDNYEALKSFRYFSARPRQSKYCYELPMSTSNVSFLLRAMFLHGNATQLRLPTTFGLYVNGSIWTNVSFTDRRDISNPYVIEGIFFNPSNGSITNVCLVPEKGVPFISSLELREFDREGIMYTESFYDQDPIRDGKFFGNMIRWNTGALNTSTVRYPDDPYDRLWSYPGNGWTLHNTSFSQYPPGGWELQNISSPRAWSNIGPEINNVPSEVMKDAWTAQYGVDLQIPLNLSTDNSTIGVFYFALLNESTINSSLTFNLNLNTSQCAYLNISSQPFQQSCPYNDNPNVTSADYIDIQFTSAFILNALEIYSQQSFQTSFTFVQHVDIVNQIKDLLNMSKWQGDPCTPVPYDWINCSPDLSDPRQYFVNVLTLSNFAGKDSKRLLELNTTINDWVVYNISIKKSNFNSELVRFLFTDLIDAKSMQFMDFSHNNITDDIADQSFFSNFTSLTTLNFSYNKFEGGIPLSLSPSNLPKLTTLDISNNNFSQEFPSSLFFESNVSFQALYADNNEITGVLNLTWWYTMLETALSNPCTANETIDAANQIFSFKNNKITSIEPSAKEFDLLLERLIVRDSFNRSGVLLGGNPYCNHANSFARKYLCRSNATEIINPDVKKERNMLPIILGSVLGSIFLVLCFAFFTWKIWRLSKAVDSLLIEKELAKRKVQPPYFFYNDLKSATQNFHDNKKLGRGNFGAVYKGVLSDGTIIAVKRLFNSEKNQVLDDFLNEVVLITGIKHKNLIQLKGCCIEHQERILVYGYAENGNIEDALWGKNPEKTLSWENRFKICMGIASGLTYLHENLQPRIIHRDIKPANVLLDKNFDPKIADFGLAKHFLEDIDVHVTQVISGTRGYFAPEYISEGRISTKVDVFSFGVLVLEIVSGRHCIDPRLPPEECQLISYAHKLQRSGSLLELLDPAVGEDYPQTQVLKVINIALMCVRRDPDFRPTMSEVETMLLEGKGSTFDKLNAAALIEERDMSMNSIFNTFGSEMGAETIAMLFPNRRTSSRSRVGSQMRDVDEASPLLRGNSVETTTEELPSFETREEYNRAVRSMHRSLSERITRPSADYM